ncbi:MAG TPA: GNAT family N-acetyltransferase [Capsulimonadaceae bacterium]|nr:GNAT family N-acetyltransferase [Capsulimonadaceae bacterium]
MASLSHNDISPVSFRCAADTEAPGLAEMIYLCGPNLLSQAFGPGYEETVRCLSMLAAAPMTMFSHQFARIAVLEAENNQEPVRSAGLVIGLAYGDYAESERRLGQMVLKHKGWWRTLRMLPLATELSRCAEPLAQGSYYISALSVREGLRGQGIGSALLNLSQELAVSAGCQTLVLDVEVGNSTAQRLYERMGYTVTSECKPGPVMRRRGIMGLRRMKRPV